MVPTSATAVFTILFLLAVNVAQAALLTRAADTTDKYCGKYTIVYNQNEKGIRKHNWKKSNILWYLQLYLAPHI